VVGDRGCVVAEGIGVKAAGAHDDVVWDAAAGRDPRREALDMEAAIADALARNTRLRRHRVTITVGPDGLVTLTGTVPTQSLRREIELSCWTVSGVRSLHDDLIVGR
jgi:osmotically-inducible protein OsmY